MANIPPKQSDKGYYADDYLEDANTGLEEAREVFDSVPSPNSSRLTEALEKLKRIT